MVRRTNCGELHLKQSRQRRKIFFQIRQILPLWAHCVPFEMIDLRWNGNPNLQKMSKNKIGQSFLLLTDWWAVTLQYNTINEYYAQTAVSRDGLGKINDRHAFIHSFIHFVSFRFICSLEAKITHNLNRTICKQFNVSEGRELNLKLKKQNRIWEYINFMPLVVRQPSNIATCMRSLRDHSYQMNRIPTSYT